MPRAGTEEQVEDEGRAKERLHIRVTRDKEERAYQTSEACRDGKTIGAVGKGGQN
jgi:hypothetical protein